MKSAVKVPTSVMKNKSAILNNVDLKTLDEVFKRTRADSIPLSEFVKDNNVGLFPDQYVIIRNEMDSKKIQTDKEPVDFPKSEQVISIVSSRYKLVNHDEVVCPIIHTLTDNHVNFSIPQLYVDQKPGRNNLYARLMLNDITIDVDGSNIHPTIDVFNSTDGLLSAGMIFGAYRLVCSNGMMIGEAFEMSKIVHTPSFFEKFNFERIFNEVVAKFNNLGEQIERMQTVKLQKMMLEGLKKAGFNSMFIKHYDVILEKYLLETGESVNKDTLWGLYATATNFISNYLMLKDQRAAIKQQTILHKYVREFQAAA